MQILVNNETLNVNLETEERIGEVYNSLCTWIEKAGMYPLALHLDFQEVDLQQAPWREYLIDDVQHFNLQAGTINHVRQQQLVTVIDYLLLLKQLIERVQAGERLTEEFADAFVEYDHVRAVLPEILRLSAEGFSEDFGQLDQMAVQVYADGIDSPVLTKFFEQLNQLRTILIDRLKEISQPVKEIQGTAEILRNILPSLEEAGTALQTGKERDAYILVLQISELIAKSIRVIDILAIKYPAYSFEEVQATVKQLSQLIAEINETMKNKDSVLLADVLEYDLCDLLTSFVDRLILLAGEVAA